MEYQLFKDTMTHLEAAHAQATEEGNHRIIKAFDDAICDFMAQNIDHAERYYDEIETGDDYEATE